MGFSTFVHNLNLYAIFSHLQKSSLLNSDKNDSVNVPLRSSPQISKEISVYSPPGRATSLFCCYILYLNARY